MTLTPEAKNWIIEHGYDTTYAQDH
ncbi:hypothetical protein [Neoehrlichia mikurensis]